MATLWEDWEPVEEDELNHSPCIEPDCDGVYMPFAATDDEGHWWLWWGCSQHGGLWNEIDWPFLEDENEVSESDFEAVGFVVG